MDAVACSHPELEVWICAAVGEDHQVVVEEHNQRFVAYFQPGSSVVPMRSDSSITYQVEGAEQDQGHQLHKWIVVPDCWNGNEDDSSDE